MNYLRQILLGATILVITACGGSSNDEHPAVIPMKALTLKLAISGQPDHNLSGIGITITLPSGVTPIFGSDGTLSAAALSVSGAAVSGTVLMPAYTPASSSTKATLSLSMASSIAAGFGAGEFITIIVQSPANSAYTQSDFELSGFYPVDINGNTANEVSVRIIMQ